MAVSSAPSLDILKHDAARLLKQARAGDPRALQRFERLDGLPDRLQLKHALAVIAREVGFAGWADLKQARSGLDFTEFFASPGLSDTLNAWFTNYDEARAFRAANGGVLLPYRRHYFVTSSAILDRLGFEAGHRDWASIGHDFAHPADTAAHARIKAALERRFAQNEKSKG